MILSGKLKFHSKTTRHQPNRPLLRNDRFKTHHTCDKIKILPISPYSMLNKPTNFSGRVGSASTAFQTGSQALISFSNPKVGFKSKMRGAKPRQLVCRHVILYVSMSASPAEIIAKSTRTLSSWGPKKEFDKKR